MKETKCNPTDCNKACKVCPWKVQDAAHEDKCGMRGLSWALGLTTAMVLAAGYVFSVDLETLREVKAGVDERGTYKFYGRSPDDVAVTDGRFNGNCSVFAKTYQAEAREAGAGFVTVAMNRNKRGICHAVTRVVTAKGVYILDNELDDVLPENEWYAKNYGGKC
jgi:predicted transglutaminase-like cysteine proteinase